MPADDHVMFYANDQPVMVVVPEDMACVSRERWLAMAAVVQAANAWYGTQPGSDEEDNALEALMRTLDAHNALAAVERGEGDADG